MFPAQKRVSAQGFVCLFGIIAPTLSLDVFEIIAGAQAYSKWINPINLLIGLQALAFINVSTFENI